MSEPEEVTPETLKRRKKKLKKLKLPNEMIVLKNPDKAFHESWHDRRNPLNIPHPYRAVCLGPPNSGKTNVVKNLLIRAKPPFKEVFVIHCDPNYTKEYDDIGATILDSIPAPEEWEGLVKTLVVLDDLEFKDMDKQQKRNLNRLFGFVSTHKQISCVLCSQDPFTVPALVRRCSNLWVLWPSIDVDSMATCARKTGLKSHQLRDMFNNLCKEKTDSVWIDTTNKTPYPLRLNGFTPIEPDDEDD